MTKTIENLKAAIIGESTASATYAAYAAKAAQEGQPLIQKLFEAASKAESVHAANHNKVLEKLGANMDPFDIQIHVGSTAENLKAAIAGETHEFESMYPDLSPQRRKKDRRPPSVPSPGPRKRKRNMPNFTQPPSRPWKTETPAPCPDNTGSALCAGTPSNLWKVWKPAPSAAPRLKNSSSLDKLRLSTGDLP